MAGAGSTILFATHGIDEEQLTLDLPDERDQLHARAAPPFAELRTHVHEQIQAAKRGDARTRTPGVPDPADQAPSAT